MNIRSVSFRPSGGQLLFWVTHTHSHSQKHFLSTFCRSLQRKGSQPVRLTSCQAAPALLVSSTFPLQGTQGPWPSTSLLTGPETPGKHLVVRRTRESGVEATAAFPVVFLRNSPRLLHSSLSCTRNFWPTKISVCSHSCP